MLVSKVGDGLAVRISEDDVARLGLKEGDEVEVMVSHKPGADGVSKPTRQELIDQLKQFEGRLPAYFKFDRDEANAR